MKLLSRRYLLWLSIPLAASVASIAPAQAPAQWVDLDSLGMTAPRRLAAASSCDIWLIDDRGPIQRLRCDVGASRTWSRSVVGGSGAGPGEYGYPWSITVARDSVWLWDRRLVRLTPYAIRDAGPGRARSLAAHTSFNDAPEVAPVHGSDDVILISRRQKPGPTGIRVTLLAQRVNEVTGVVQTLFEGPDSSSIFWERDELGGRFDAPFGQGQVFQLSPARLVLVDRRAGTVQNVPIEGGAPSAVPLRVPAAAPVRQADRRRYADSVLAAALAEMGQHRYGPTLVARFRGVLDDVLGSVVFPRTMARIERVAVDERSGRIAVALVSTEPSPERNWLVQPLAGPATATPRKVPHRGAVVDAAFAGGCLVTLERLSNDATLLGRYCGW